MPNRLLLAATVLAAVSIPTISHAAPGWHLSEPIGSENAVCITAGGGGVRTLVAYYGDDTPHTGDANGVLTLQVASTCGSATVLADFHLPPGVEQDMSKDVECWRTRGRAASQPFANFDPRIGACSNRPMANDRNLQNMLAWFKLQEGEMVEVGIPVVFARPQPRAQNTFRVDVEHSYGCSNPNNPSSCWEQQLQPNISFAVGLLPQFAMYKQDIVLETKLRVNANVTHYHSPGTLLFDYGTTPNLGLTASWGDLDPNARTTEAGKSLGNLSPGTTYYWRARIVTPFGTFVGDMQTGRTCSGKGC